MRKPARGVLVLFCACLYFGCANYDPYRAPWDNLFSPSRPSYSSASSRSYYSSPSYSTSYERHRRSEHRRVARNRSSGSESTASRGEDISPNTDRPPPATTLASNPPASLSLAGDGGDRARAQHLLTSVDAKLMRIHAQSLKGAQKETYERATQLAHRAHRALADDDCAAASSLAAKASSLAAAIH